MIFPESSRTALARTLLLLLLLLLVAQDASASTFGAVHHAASFSRPSRRSTAGMLAVNHHHHHRRRGGGVSSSSSGGEEEELLGLSFLSRSDSMDHDITTTQPCRSIGNTLLRGALLRIASDLSVSANNQKIISTTSRVLL